MKHVDGEFTLLIQTVATLRGEDGCPWDKKQTARSLIKYLLEESQELAEAIESDDPDNICEEIGDVYFILVMLSLIHAEKNQFQISTPLKKITEKMIRRHPHVFGDTIYTSEEELRDQWNQIKKSEKKHSLSNF